MFRPRKIKLLIFFLLLFFLLGASFIFAQKPLEVTYPEIPGAKTPTTTKEALPDYIRYIYYLSLFLAGILALGSFVYGGVRYLTSGGSPAIQNDAKSQILAGLWGLVILVFAFAVLNIINPQLTSFGVSLPGIPTTKTGGVAPPKSLTNTHIEIPLGGLIENLWGEKRVGAAVYEKGFKPTECYQFDSEGDRTTNDPLENQDRMTCIKNLSEAIRVKAERLKEPVEELQEFYSQLNCCESCCYNVCSTWITCDDICDQGGVWPWWQWENCQGTCCQDTQKEGCWAGCDPAYSYCEGLDMRNDAKYYCRGAVCGYFQECQCQDCLESICRYPDTKEPCGYEDPIIQEKITRIKEALIEFQVKMGFFPLTEKMANQDNLDLLLAGDTKILIKNLLLYKEPGYGEIDEEKLKEILKLKEVTTYLIDEWEYRELLLSNQNMVKIMARALDILGNEIAVNEIAWMGTTANENQEWLELYNNTKGDISLEGWQIIAADGSPTIYLSGQIPAQGFYLLENNEAATDIPADLIFSGNLDNGGEKLGLYDQYGNLADKVNCLGGWFAGETDPETSMERINPQDEGSDSKNWATNLSIEAEGEEEKADLINGKDSAGNPIYGTPKSSNSAGWLVPSYPSFDNLAWQIREKILGQETLKEKLILVLRNAENLEKMIKTKEFLGDVLMGSDERLKRLLKERQVLRILFEDEENLNAILADSHAEELFRQLLNMDGPEKDAAWQDLIANKLTETITNSKLIADFERDLRWIIETGELMRGCEEDPLSIDQARVPDLIPNMKIEKVPEWEEIKTELKFPGEAEAGHDPAIFYCHKLLW